MQGLVDAGLDAVVIDLVRDPRDVFASIQAFNSARAYLGFGRRADQSASEYLETQVENWKRRIEVMRIPIAGARTILIRYEDMVADLAGVAAHLGGLLSISMDASRVEADRERYTQHMTSDGGAGSVGRWRRDLSAAESGRIERTLGDELAHFGYR
ncbi:MAG: sulfotransferase [Candidatus Dormibacteraeota bacterium]|nr:sulfotransferase [Candidatus Dormibacteraeota bacterium]